MKAIIFGFICLFVSPAGAAVQPCPNLRPFLYKVEKGGKTSYLLGTMHAGVPVSALPEAVQNALARSHTAAFECDNDVDKKIKSLMDEASKYPPGKMLKDAVSPASFVKLESLVGRQSADKLAHYKPWAIAISFEAAVENAISKQEGVSWDAKDGIDTVLVNQAKSTNKQIQFLDNLKDIPAQLDAAMPAHDLETFLLRSNPLQFLADCNMSTRAAYCSGREDNLEQLLKSECSTKSFREKLVNDRNRAWMPSLTRLFGEGDVFAGVGALHLVGPSGLISLLRGAGYTVTQVELGTTQDPSAQLPPQQTIR